MSDQPPTCCICGREMRRATKPHWVFGRDYSVRGQAHSSCTLRAPWAGAWSMGRVSSGTPLATLQFHIWVLHQPHAYESPEYYAVLLALATDAAVASGDLSAEQQRRLDWWQRGPLRLSDSQTQAIRAAYGALLEGFRAAKLPPVPEASS